jgi:hypothetical protein
MKKWIILALSALALSACSSESVSVMKSPCVGIDGSPCGPTRPVNGNYNTDS